MALRRKALFVALLGLAACGSRTALHGGGVDQGDGGATTSSASTGGDTPGDPCAQALGPAVIAKLPPGVDPASPETHWIFGSSVVGDTLYFADAWSLFAVPTCGGDVRFLHANPDGGLLPDVSSYPFGRIGAMAASPDGIYWWAYDGVSGMFEPRLWRTSLDGSKSTTVVTTPFDFPALTSGPSGIFLLDAAVRRVNPDDTVDYLGSAAPLEYVSLPAFDGASIYFSGATSEPFGPVFHIPLAGGELVIGAPQPWLREIVGDGAPFYGIQGGSPARIVTLSTDGVPTVLADDQPWDAKDLRLVGPHLVFRACEAIWEVDRETGVVVVVHGQPDCEPLDPDEDPNEDHAPKQRELAVDSRAFYLFEGDEIVRVRLE